MSWVNFEADNPKQVEEKLIAANAGTSVTISINTGRGKYIVYYYKGQDPIEGKRWKFVGSDGNGDTIITLMNQNNLDHDCAAVSLNKDQGVYDLWGYM